MADTPYDSDRLRNAIADKGAVAVIPNNSSRAQKYPLDKHLYAQRHLIECCFSRLKQFRRVATRFETSKKRPKTTSQSSLSQQSSYGSDNCPHFLDVQQARLTTSARQRPRCSRRQFPASRKYSRLLLVSQIPQLTPTGDHLDPAILSFMNGISAISNHPVPLLSMKELVSRPQSEKEGGLSVALTPFSTR